MTFFKWIFILFLLATKTAAALDKEAPVDFSADELTYDRETNLIIARGNVTFKQENSSLRADHINYDTVDGVVIASGNVEIYTPDGGLMQGNYARLSGDLKEGIIRKIKYTLADKSVLTAQKAEHFQGNFTEFEDIAYSSCDFCEDGSRFWEVKAQKLVHDKEARDMSAYNATMTIEDVPVMYFPYFSYPDPTVKRRSGFLIPNIKSNRAMGLGVTVPYYWEISPYTDFLFSPLIATKGILWGGTLRKNFSQGKAEISGSYIRQDGENRYNIVGGADWHISDIWRAHLNIDKASDATYLRRYDLRSSDVNSPWLKSDAAVEALTSDTYFTFGGFHYQNMRAYINDDTIPEAAPLAQFVYTTDPSENGGYWTFGASTATLTRKQGDDSSRLSLETDWTLPGITDWGAVYNFNASALVNGYHITDYWIANENRLYSGNVSSFNPQTALTISYPFVNVGEKYNQILEPIVMGILAPNSKNSSKIPNEDSNDLDFDDTNLFSEKRFVGFDRFEPGSRINYGLKWSAYGQKNGYVSALIGQSYRFTHSDIFPADSGLVDQASDIVGRFNIQPNEFISLSYAFRMNRKTTNINRSNLSVSVGNALLRVSASYINLKSSVSEYSAYNNREEINYTLTSHLTRYLKISFNQRINLSKGGSVLETGGSLRYEDECFALETGLKKDYTADRDYENGITFKLGVEFKPFGIFKM
ncbi:MAG: LPS-assembly protein LptD [Alphaproteobacteria bacterium]|nr:LPS-assembly protein LptD [Alphaproteobacteria bacterium]MBO4643965.1 LPS-assembly protein LptD [Alphaproteobacteria bacterium]